MTWPQPTGKDHERFCQVEGWRKVRTARGRTGTHHLTFELDLPDGSVLRTRVSHPVDRTDYGPSLWQHIRRDQLRVGEAAFWACVTDGAKPDRGVPRKRPESLPADVVHLLITRVGLTESEVAGMSKKEAIGRLQQFWTDYS